jgi:hypothetical protein
MFLPKALWLAPYFLLFGLLYVGRLFKRSAHFASYISEKQLPGITFSQKHGSSQMMKTSIITVATGGYDATLLATSARNHGRFQNPMIIISDNPNYDDEWDKYDVVVIHVDKPKDSLDAVSLKTKVFEIIDSAFAKQSKGLQDLPLTSNLLYLDADIQVNSDIEFFLDAVGDWDPKCSIYAVPERWYAASTWNTGTMLLDRLHSANFLREWNNIIVNNYQYIRKGQNVYSKDQWALMKLLLEDNANQYKVCPLPSSVSFAADFMTRYVWGAYDSTFTHFTSSKKDFGFSNKDHTSKDISTSLRQ